jgi:hypothetical protein
MTRVKMSGTYTDDGDFLEGCGRHGGVEVNRGMDRLR